MNKYGNLLLLFLFLIASSAVSGQELKAMGGKYVSLENAADIQAGVPIAAGQPKFLGCAYSSGQAFNFTSYWNQVSPENGGKWGSVEGTRGVMRWTDLDAAYNVAKNNGMLFKQHTLIWGAQQPSWIGQLDSATQRMEIEQWFSLLAARYPNMAYIDVVNEPLHNAPNGMLPWGASTPNVNYAKALGGAGKTGWDWIITSFRLARKYFPNSKLIMNEYGVINSTTETQKYINIIKLLKADTLIDGIGEQAHAFTTAGTTSATLKANLDALAATGIPIYLTEVDIDGSTDLIQLKEMQRVFPIFWDHPGVQGITFWGFRIGLWRSDQGAYLINSKGEERPALKWLRAYVNNTVVNIQSINVMAIDSSSTINKIGGTLKMVAHVLPANATIPNITWSIAPAGRATIDANGLLTALATGNVIVTATSWDGSGVKGTKIIVVTNATTGIDDKSFTDQVTVYPNPALNGSFTVKGIGSITRIELVNLVGKKIVEFNHISQSTLNIQVNEAPGTYILKFFDGAKVGYKKIILQ